MLEFPMKKSNIFLSCLIFISISFVLFFSRQIFNFKYEPEYYENLFYHSQWNIPNSTRGIGDGDLYKFVGYRLIEGENPFNINYEVPPFGKLLFGLAEKYIGNPYWVGIVLYFLSIGTLALLAKDLFKKNNTILAILFLFVTTPIVATQLKETMLDLPIMFLLLVHTLFFTRFLSNKKINYLIASGIFLGLFTGTKIGIYTPLIGIFGAIVVLVSSKKKVWNFLVYFASVIAGYVFSYIDYFVQHPNPIPWLRLHMKPILFYMDSNIPVDHLNQWKTIFLNIYQGWWNPGQIIRINDWSPLLPLGVIALIIASVFAIKKQKTEWIYISGLTAIFLLVNSFLAFWPRYLIPIVPFFILLIAYSTKKFRFIIILIALINIPFFIKGMTPDTLPDAVSGAATSITTRAYRDMYRTLTPSNITEENFINQNKLIWDQLAIRNIEMTLINSNKSGKKATAKYQLKLITKYGDLIETPTLNFTFINNQWKLDWNYNYLIENFIPGDKIIVEKEKVSTKDTVSLRSIYIVPQLISNWNQSLDSLSSLTGQRGMQIDKQIKTVVPDQYPQFIGYLKPELGKDGVTQALATHGVSVDEPDNFFSPKVVTFKEQVSGYYVKAKVYLEKSDGQKTLIPIQAPN